MPRRMDQRSVERISKAVGPNNDFTRRASMAVRNASQEDGKKAEDSSGKQKTAEKEDDDKQTQRTSG
ncbi:hypothetical protein F5B17DRAFT_427591 [Nemania serpens]|nr:hypothetical protein F5B17DRAFT_427591 [Nemania serpens]